MIETFANGMVRSWASILDDVTREQAIQTSELPILVAPLALMPDAHLGAGATIGSVLVTENAIIPMAVGVDIGCGMAARKLDLNIANLGDTTPRDWVRIAGHTVPAGLGKWHEAASMLATNWIERNPVPANLPQGAERAAAQLGTLGSGNHFIELSVDESGAVWLLLHSGSRGAGNKLAQIHAKAAIVMNGEEAPHRDLAWLDGGTPEFNAYVNDLYWSQSYARENRILLLNGAHRALEAAMGFEVITVDEVNCHHNYAQLEQVAELGRPLFVTRKGAISARVGDRGLIPGAMGQASYVVRGLGNPDSYESCSHGAGRVMSRTRARKEIALGDFTDRMEGVAWQDRNAEALLDEAPQSYKDIDVVMRDQADLVAIDFRLKAIANYKGVEEKRKRG